MLNWRPGMKLVCVDTRGVPDGILKIGTVYTLRGIDWDFKTIGEVILGPAIWVQEIHSPISKRTGKEYGFWWWRFRPAVDDRGEKEIQKLKELLDNLPQHIKEEEFIE